MKFIVQFIAILFFSHLMDLFLPWYSTAIAAFVVGYFLKSRLTFLAGFLAIATLWTFNAWLIDSSSTSDLATRVSHIFHLSHVVLLYILMATIGGIVGGFAAMTGALLRGTVAD
jgi:hypothetical protein